MYRKQLDFFFWYSLFISSFHLTIDFFLIGLQASCTSFHVCTVLWVLTGAKSHMITTIKTWHSSVTLKNPLTLFLYGQFLCPFPAPDVFSIFTILLYPKCHKWNIYSVFFWVWLFSVSKMYLGLILVVCFSWLFLIIAEYYSVV